jgi:4-hydroxyproline epimerase
MKTTMNNQGVRRVQIIDSHTGGEPTRVVVGGGPDLGSGSMAERLAIFREKHDAFRSAVVDEPRGSEVIVGALLCEPVDPKATAGVIFFNNVGYLHMCGHGTIGLMVTLAYMGKVTSGEHVIETPVGNVRATLQGSGKVTINNVPSYRFQKKVKVDVEGHGPVHGDVAWGGNWFFLVSDHGQEISYRKVAELTDFSWRIRQALVRNGITGENGQEIDHVELFGPPQAKEADSKNFVLCPGNAYDRSPCGTGTSAKLACLAADGTLKEGQVWRQESIVGSVFEGRIAGSQGGKIVPSITGSAFVNSEATLILDPNDPFQFGLRV